MRLVIYVVPTFEVREAKASVRRQLAKAGHRWTPVNTYPNPEVVGAHLLAFEAPTHIHREFQRCSGYPVDQDLS